MISNYAAGRVCEEVGVVPISLEMIKDKQGLSPAYYELLNDTIEKLNLEVNIYRNPVILLQYHFLKYL